MPNKYKIPCTNSTNHLFVIALYFRFIRLDKNYMAQKTSTLFVKLLYYYQKIGSQKPLIFSENIK